MMPRHAASFSLAILALAFTLPAAALKTDRDHPMDVNADHFDGSTSGGLSTLTGSVKITQGTLAVDADKAVVHQSDKREIVRAVLTGKPAHLAQDLDEGGRLKARAGEIDYDIAAETVVFTGDVVIEQPRGELRGEKVTYELKTGKLTGSGEGAAGRVHLRMNPQPKAAKKE
jgi:lipopolysaccharide export system protein LptA